MSPHIPKPFSRASISIPANAVKREWANVLPATLRPGDIVAGWGEVIEAGEDFLVFQSGKRSVRPDSPVPAFTSVRG